MDTRQKNRQPGGSPPPRAGRKAPPGNARRPARRKPQRRANRPEVVYTPPKPLSRGRLLLQLATVAAVVVALIFGVSIFFKVRTITVSGGEKYSAWTVREASGIREGDNLLTFSEARASGKIRAALPYVKSVRIGIKLPDTVNIEIVELDVVYSIQDQDNMWWLMTSDGRVLEQADSARAGEYTKVAGVRLDHPQTGAQAVAMEAPGGPLLPVPEAPTGGTDGEDADTEVTDPKTTPETAPPTVLGSERLAAALKILQCLESSGVIGEAVNVDVSDLNQLTLQYGRQYRVKLGDIARMDYKISCMKSAVAQMSDYQSGELDVSFTIWPNEVGYTPAL